MNGITKKKLIKYFDVTKNVLEKAKTAPENLNITDSTKEEIINMIEKY